MIENENYFDFGTLWIIDTILHDNVDVELRKDAIEETIKFN